MKKGVDKREVMNYLKNKSPLPTENIFLIFEENIFFGRKCQSKTPKVRTSIEKSYFS